MHSVLNRLLLIAVVAISPCFIGWQTADANESTEPTKVNVFYPTSEQHQRSLILTGTVEAKQHAQLAPLQEGVVAELFVEQGDHVEKNQKLLALDAKLAKLELARFAAEVRSAEAAKTEAKRLYQEVLGLSKKQLVPKTQMEERFSAVAVADAEFNRAEALLALQQEILDRHTLYAPFAGVISERQINLGEWVTRQMSVFTLVERQNLWLSLQVPQEYFNRLANAQEVKVNLLSDSTSINATSNTSNPVTLTRLVQVVNNNSRTLTALVDLPAGKGWVAGMSARAEILVPNGTSGSTERIAWVPKSAVKTHPDGGNSVFAVEQGKAKRYLVKAIEREGDRIAVQGLPDGLGVVVSGVELLQDDDPLEIEDVMGEQP